MSMVRSCQRCGGCCKAHVALLARSADLARWRRSGRQDILAAIRLAEAGASAGGELGDGAYVAPCPFLVRGGGPHTCSIYTERPMVCREFAPGSALCSGDAATGQGRQ